VPPLPAVAFGREASYFMIWVVEPGIVTHCWPGRLPAAAPSSIVPLQSLSRPSQVSALAPGAGVVITQTAGPFGAAVLHWKVPVARQSPTPPVPHARPRFGWPSSIAPSQSLSLPSHRVSAVMLPIASVETSGSV
jgi:hypothetical protein